MDVAELAPGLWRWTAPHPEWTPAEGGPEGWEENVAAYYCEAEGEWTLPKVQRDLALHMDDDIAEVRAGMKWLHVLFVTAGLLLAVEISCWLIEYAK